MITMMYSEVSDTTTREEEIVVAVKIGGSSITQKDKRETLNEQGINWFISSIKDVVSPRFRCDDSEDGRENIETSSSSSLPTPPTQNKRAFIVVHGAGSFGHHHAKEYGLQGKTEKPSSQEEESSVVSQNRLMTGLVHTRLSVQRLNQIVVRMLVDAGIKAVAISPAFGFQMEAHGGDEAVHGRLLHEVRRALEAGLIPVLHGDACLYGPNGAGILSGDTLMQILGQADWVNEAVFVTDVDGVFSCDPKTNPDLAILVPVIEVDPSGNITSLAHSTLKASESTHDHDVTGGLKTKLAAAVSIASQDKKVYIVRCNRDSTKEVLAGKGTNDGFPVSGTLIRRHNETA